MIQKLGDAQRFLIREMFVCFMGLNASIFKDVMHNLLHAAGLTATQATVNFGLYQIGGTMFFGFFLIVSASEFWLYYQPNWGEMIFGKREEKRTFTQPHIS